MVRLVVDDDKARGDGVGDGTELAMASQGDGMRGDSLSVSPNMASIYGVLVCLVDGFGLEDDGLIKISEGSLLQLERRVNVDMLRGNVGVNVWERNAPV